MQFNNFPPGVAARAPVIPEIEFLGEYTPGSQTIGPLGDEASGKRIVVIAAYRENDNDGYMSSCTIDGVSATLAFSQNISDTLGIAYRVVASGTGNIAIATSLAGSTVSTFSFFYAWIIRGVDSLVGNLTMDSNGNFGPIVVSKPAAILSIDRARTWRGNTSLIMAYPSNFETPVEDYDYNTNGSGNVSLAAYSMITSGARISGNLGNGQQWSTTGLSGAALVFE
tara:strand:+ start:290 stop:964 length:675 start_codon:yes stop_codon:yes gene_type:complete